MDNLFSDLLRLLTPQLKSSGSISVEEKKSSRTPNEGPLRDSRENFRKRRETETAEPHTHATILQSQHSLHFC